VPSNPSNPSAPGDATGPSRRIDAERCDAAEQVAALTREFDQIVESSELVSTDDEHDPEGATIAYERAKTAALLRSARARLADLDRSLERVRQGTYGQCAACGGPIGDDRLEALPSTDRCVDCAARGRGSAATPGVAAP